MRRPTTWIFVALVAATGATGCATSARRGAGLSSLHAGGGLSAPSQRVVETTPTPLATATSNAEGSAGDHEGVFAKGERGDRLNRFFPGLLAKPAPAEPSSATAKRTEPRTSWLGRHLPHLRLPGSGTPTVPPTTLTYSTAPRFRTNPARGGEPISVLPVALTVPVENPRDRLVAKASAPDPTESKRPERVEPVEPTIEEMLAPADPRFLLPTASGATPAAPDPDPAPAAEEPRPTQPAAAIPEPAPVAAPAEPEPAPAATPAAEVAAPAPHPAAPAEPSLPDFKSADVTPPAPTPVPEPAPAAEPPAAVEPTAPAVAEPATPVTAAPAGTEPATPAFPEPGPAPAAKPRASPRVAEAPDPRERPRLPRPGTELAPAARPQATRTPAASAAQPEPQAAPAPSRQAAPRPVPSKVIPPVAATAAKTDRKTVAANREGNPAPKDAAPARPHDQDRAVRAARVQAEASRTLGLPDPTLPPSYYRIDAPPVRGDSEVATTGATVTQPASPFGHSEAARPAGACPHCGHDPHWRPSLQRLGRRLLGVGEFAPKDAAAHH